MGAIPTHRTKTRDEIWTLAVDIGGSGIKATVLDTHGADVTTRRDRARSGLAKLLRDNGLSITFGLLFVVFLLGQSVAGHRSYNEDQEAHNEPKLTYWSYLWSSHFAEATFENWESEFLQMAAYVLLTAILFQRGSAESNDPDKPETAPSRPRDVKRIPGPVRRGGMVLKLYEHSLGLAFALIFLISFSLHAVSGATRYNDEQSGHGRPGVSVPEYLGTSRFWFESFQNWQSEFLAILAMVVLSIFLRQKGSPESKDVESPHSETGA
jgi:Domain of unknown function (DUF6766)